MAYCSWFKEEVYRDHFEPGKYVCVECNHDLFSSRAKYNHSTPWPAFTQPIHSKSLKKISQENRSGALKILCGNCDSGLGHEFLKDGPDGETSRF